MTRGIVFEVARRRRGIVRFGGAIVVALAAGIGLYVLSQRQKVDASGVPPRDRVRLLPNPAYRVCAHGTGVALVTNAGQPTEKRFELDETSLLLWNVLSGSAVVEAGRTNPVSRGLTRDDLLRQALAAWPARPPQSVTARVDAFVVRAMTQGIVIEDSVPLRVEVRAFAVQDGVAD